MLVARSRARRGIGGGPRLTLRVRFSISETLKGEAKSEATYEFRVFLSIRTTTTKCQSRGNAVSVAARTRQ